MNKLAFITYIAFLFLTSNFTFAYDNIPTIGKKFVKKEISNKEVLISFKENTSYNMFNDITIEAACLINIKKEPITQHCQIDFINKKEKRFLSHRLRYYSSNKTIELTIKDSRNISVHRKIFSTNTNWLPSWMIIPYVKFAQSRVTKEKRITIIDVNGFKHKAKLQKIIDQIKVQPNNL